MRRGCGLSRVIHLTRYLCDGGVLTSAKIRERCGVSKATATRLMRVLETELPLIVDVDRSLGPRARRSLRLERRP